MPRIVLRPALATLALHGVVIWLMTVNWSLSQRELVTIKPTPVAIDARLVDVSELQTRPEPKPQPKPVPAAKPEPAPAPKPQPVEKPKVEAAPKPQPAAQPKPRVEPKPEAQTRPTKTPAEIAAMMQEELAGAIAAENSAEAMATADEMAASFAALIRQTVVGYWSRPPSARNGMEALLQVQLIPTGEVVSVSILKSSGDSAFDRSAVNAVEKAGAFPELQRLPDREFERTFRRFRLLFRPEDLRY